MTIPVITAQLQVEKIESNTGYTIIQDKTSYIPNTYNYSLHIIDTVYLDKSIRELIITSSQIPNENDRDILNNELSNLITKMSTLKFGHNTITRKRRGLINAIGTFNKWLTGTMDDEYRNLINQHLDNIENKNLELINDLNDQIRINNNFNTSINILLDTIKNDRLIIQESMKNKINETYLKFITVDIRLKIQTLNRIINDLQDNIILSNLNIIHPSLLSYNEINEYKINADKLKLLRIGFTKTTSNKLIFLIKIPYEMVEINEKIILPLATENNCNILNYPTTRIFEYKNTYFEYSKDKSLNQLNNLKHCIISKSCYNTKNCNTEIINIDDSSILIQLAYNISLTSSFDERKFVLNGNYFIKFYNGSINLNNQTFYNNIKEITNKYTIPNLDYKSENNTLSFKEINIETLKNINEIEIIKYHRIITYSSIGMIIIIILIISIAILIIFCKFKFINKIQENFNLKGGEVTFHATNSFLDLQQQHSNMFKSIHNQEPSSGINAHKAILF